MPRLSDSMEDGTIVRWLVEDGGAVAAGQELVEIETDKAVMTYEAEAAGTLAIAAGEGETVAVGDPIGQLLGAGESAPEAAPAQSAAAPAASSTGPAAAAPAPTTRHGALTPPRAADGTRLRVSPVARRIAAERGVDLVGLAGSGPGSRIVKRDVLGVAGNGAAPQAPATGSAVEGARGGARFEPASRVQQTIARRMAEAKANQPEFALEIEIEMGPALDLRARLKQAAAGAGLAAPSVNDLIVRAAALALREHPRVNGAYGDGGFELYDRVNVGVAVAAEGTLLVPVVADADRLSLDEIAARTSALSAKAREGTLTAPELSGGTFTVSNLGMFGITSFTAILNHPQAAILAVGAVREIPVAVDGELAIGRRMNATLICDHRILYGADAAAFLGGVRTRLEEPFGLLLQGGTR